jgi:prophage antirepressor-like protein
MDNIQNKKLCLVVSAGVTVNLLPADKHEFLIPVSDVAKGYNVPVATIQDCVHCHAMEFEEGKHFLTHPEDDNLMWTKRGVVRLGFFINGAKARIFRDMIEDLKLSPTPESSDTFIFGDNHIVQIVMINKEPWFVAADVCKVLGLQNPTARLKERLDDDEYLTYVIRRSGQNDEKLTYTVYTSDQNRKVNLVNESGLYNLIFQSRKSGAKAFRKWVTSEVLPAIRRTGKYTPEIVENDCPYTKGFSEILPAIDTSGLLLDIMDDVCYIEDYGLRTRIAAKIKTLCNIDIH